MIKSFPLLLPPVGRLARPLTRAEDLHRCRGCGQPVFFLDGDLVTALLVSHAAAGRLLTDASDVWVRVLDPADGALSALIFDPPVLQLLDQHEVFLVGHERMPGSDCVRLDPEKMRAAGVWLSQDADPRGAHVFVSRSRRTVGESR